MKSLKVPELWVGIVCGIIVCTILGFWLLGWTLGDTAEKMAQDRAEAVVVAALVPICVDQGRRASTADLEALKTTDSWKRYVFVEMKGWATMPGAKEPTPHIASPCAEKLLQ
ncbi:hypothetical protein IID27_03105 [Patescibacteria group bacterium]|nr:hypothetical protein [Patescibacteria group bacterium]